MTAVNVPFESFAQNGEDVVLHRALRDIPSGRYVEVGANHPTESSISRSFYDRGWRGLTIDALPGWVDLHRLSRPGDIQVQAAITDADVESITIYQIGGTGLSTLVEQIGDMHAAAGYDRTAVEVPAERLDTLLTEAGWAGLDIHFVMVDVEGAEAGVLRSIDLTQWRPWVFVVEATLPNSTVQNHQEWEHLLLDADYEFCLFDGLSRFYVSKELAPALRGLLSYPACVFDEYTTPTIRAVVRQHREAAAQQYAQAVQLQTELATSRREALQWQTRVMALRGELTRL